ncbi:MAG: molybdopterin-synthase adenylyltransferase MoeB [Gloeomargarita sp. SKYBB_i_bin120]|nr:molybdopterin-synthase adenylyltransferase MoeB [Gloeomargarita sp. SKYG98]MCS7293505.1 molybdopterin-synthase adenylyltransferase MoeB [Gloeomargarita sp. SKYB120]MDW8179071.1 molybdopterin-synthase adenylyltransferase MoeB [Gloeomargarita sp. SKYBB_i_bin120]
MTVLETVELTQAEYERYSRHLLLPGVGVAGQKKLKAAKVLCVGTGGLGSPVLLYLAAAGIGHLGIVDFDVVDISNLQRQIIHSVDRLGQSKAQSAKDRIAQLNPHCQVELYETQLTAANALDILRPYDVIVDGTDNFPTRYLINDACTLLGKPFVYGSILWFEGQVSVFNYQGGPTYRDLFPEPPPPGEVPSCAEGGVLGVLPGVIGALQATEVLKIILGIGETLSGRLLIYDALKMKFRELKLRPHPNRPVIKELIDYEQFCGVTQARQQAQQMQADIPEITVQELQQLLTTQPDRTLLVDVRNPGEYEVARIDGAVLIPLSELEQGPGLDKLRQLWSDKQLVVHCKSGARSLKALHLIKEKTGRVGYNVKGGILAWSREIDPSVPQY